MNMTFKVTVFALLIAGNSAWTETPNSQRLVATDAPRGTVTATVDLAREFPQIAQLQGYVFTQTFTTVAPGTGRAWHSHAGSPEIVRILSGTLTDARNGGPPKTYGPGSTLINAGGTQHMWANLGTEPVVFVATSVHASH
jgi:quercetin dioxygenase-like cupin family protein